MNFRYMSAEPLTTFESSLDELGVEFVQTTSDQFESTLTPLLDMPTVGTPLPFENVSLPDAVETDPTVQELEAAETGVTAAGYGIADYGSVIIKAALMVRNQLVSTPTNTSLSSPAAIFFQIWTRRSIGLLRTSVVTPGKPLSRPDRVPQRIWVRSSRVPTVRWMSPSFSWRTSR